MKLTLTTEAQLRHTHVPFITSKGHSAVGAQHNTMPGFWGDGWMDVSLLGHFLRISVTKQCFVTEKKAFFLSVLWSVLFRVWVCLRVSGLSVKMHHFSDPSKTRNSSPASFMSPPSFEDSNHPRAKWHIEWLSHSALSTFAVGYLGGG